jgi:hypothetical protein
VPQPISSTRSGRRARISSTVASTHSRISPAGMGSPVKLLFQPAMSKDGSNASRSRAYSSS